ncbi:class I adenylate-forming enzyme family protein [Sphaerisporangium corydalis]|uniref:AMP-binding protein n=1 Tax=Sphaerisporangium corydalis TaxID=1441875 RepID=A0ABV9E8T0_9ACTN|nr:class I adenylate-forming enzyme family protein [Sphaerisporangium corydalis]
MMRTTTRLLATRAAEDPGRPAVTVDGVGSLTFGEWETRADAVALGLLERGLRAGDRVGLLFGGRGWIDFAVAYCAVHKAGGVAVPLSDRFPPAELAFMLADCAATGLVHDQGAAPPPYPGAWTATVADLDRGPGAPVEPDTPERDLAQILYTSGTTGRPKGVAASHANLMFGCTFTGRRRPLAHSRQFLHAFPVGTNAGQTMLVNALDARASALTLPLFTPARFGRLIESRAVGTVFVVPTMATELLKAGIHERYDLSSVRLFGSTAAALPPAVAVALGAVFPNATIVNYYTSTEAAPAQMTMIFDPARPTSVGRPASPGDIRITDEGGHPPPPGEPGHVWLRSPTTPRTYYRTHPSNPPPPGHRPVSHGNGDRATEGTVFRGRWVRMGDVGYLDGEGYLHLVDRDHDIIKSGAFKISTMKIEAALHEHPDVSDAAVFGVPHADLGTQVVAALVTSAALSLRDVRAFLAPRLAEHELPRRILIVDALPKNPAGKVLKRTLRDSLLSTT